MYFAEKDAGILGEKEIIRFSLKSRALFLNKLIHFEQLNNIISEAYSLLYIFFF